MPFALASFVALIAAPPAAEQVVVDAEAVVRYIESCRKPNGAFGPADQEYTDAAWNYAAVSSLYWLGEEIAEPEAIFAHGLGSPAGHAGVGHMQFFHQHVLRGFLKRPIEPKHRQVRVVHQGFKIEYYASPLGTDAGLLFKAGNRSGFDAHDVEADTFYYHNLSSLLYLLAGLKFSGREPLEPQPLIDYIRRRQAPNGGFVDERDGNGGAADVSAHVGSTFHAVMALGLLGVRVPNADRTAAFLHGCRLKDGAYRWNPRASLPANEADVYYVTTALHALTLLGEQPQEAAATRAWLNSLQNADGGFGDRPGWRSRLYATFYAVNALNCLGNPYDQITKKTVAPPDKQAIADGEFRIYQAQFKTPVVRPGDLAGLHKRGFNLLALKSDKLEDAERLMKAVREQKLPMDVVLCPEMYPHRLTQLGGAVLSHVGNFTLDPSWSSEQKEIWRLADTAGREYLPWTGYRDRVVKPLAGLGSLAYPEQDYEMEYSLIAYGNDRSGTKGYNAVLCGFNWPPRDFVRVFPWRERYVDRLVPIADVDAHGDLAKWSDQLDATRTLFIARGPTYADFQEAAAVGRVVTVIAEPEGVPSGASYYGPQTAVDYVRRHRTDWQWW